MQALVLDFDGVLADSAPECFEVALRTHRALDPASAIGERPRQELWAGFLSLLPLGNRAEDFGVALAALESGTTLRDQAAYDAFRDARPEGWLDRFHRCFYAQRAAFAAADPKAWCALNPPYAGFLALLRRRRGSVRLALATAKDRDAVFRLLDAWRARDLFDDALVFDKETGVSKEAHLRRAQAALGLPFEALTFVDDKVNHLATVSPLGVRCGLAAWGYNGPREQEEARARGFLVLHLHDAEAALFDASGGSGSP